MNEIKYEFEYDKNTNAPFLIVTKNIREKYKNINLMHFHKQMQIILAVEGDVVIETLYDKITLLKNSVAFVNSNVYHKIQSQSENFSEDHRYVSIIFNENILNISNNENFKSEFIDKYNNIKLKIDKSQTVINAFNEILQTKNEYGIIALISLIWYNIIIKDEADFLLDEKDKNEQLEKVLNFIEESYSLPIDIDKMCKVGSFSKSSLHRAFLKHLGVSPYSYLLEYRINKSINLLQKSNMSIAQISTEVGYENISQFIKLFKQNIGKTPLAYRKLWKK